MPSFLHQVGSLHGVPDRSVLMLCQAWYTDLQTVLHIPAQEHYQHFTVVMRYLRVLFCFPME